MMVWIKSFLKRSLFLVIALILLVNFSFFGSFRSAAAAADNPYPTVAIADFVLAVWGPMVRREMFWSVVLAASM